MPQDPDSDQSSLASWVVIISVIFIGGNLITRTPLPTILTVPLGILVGLAVGAAYTWLRRRFSRPGR
jgi:NhaP-type Na+/H+ or K+/H+ antiporter